MVGHEPSLFAASLGDVPDTGFACIEFFSPSAGVLVVGVNDRDASNNGGSFAFDVTVQAPTDDGEPTAPGEVWACAHPEMHEVYDEEW